MPETRYARNGDVHIAYQDFGEGVVTFLWIPGIVSNVELWWENPDARRFMRRFASFCRFVKYDKRGQGCSDRDAGVPTLDERLGDLEAVLDAVGAERVALGGISEGGSTAAMYAASHPERVSHLVLIGSFARIDVETGDVFVPKWAASWGTPETLSVRVIAPAKQGDAEFLRWVNRLERQSTTPGGLLTSYRWIREIDVGPLLPSIQCPTLVVHHTGDRLIPVSQGRYLAENIPGAKLLEIDSDGHLPEWGDTDRVLEAVEEFVTGHTAPRPTERVLATVVFTDIVESTARAAGLGDAAWKQLLDRHDDVSARTISDFGGRVVQGTGDGVVATFDAPGRALQCADELQVALRGLGISVRTGVHTGEIELRNGNVAGIGVNIAARVNAIADAGEVLVSRTVTDLVAGSGYTFTTRGLHQLKGVPGEWELFALEMARGHSVSA